MPTSQQAYTGKDVAQLFRAYAKKTWPQCKFSVTSSHDEVHIYLMSAPFNAWADLDDPQISKMIEFEKERNPHFDPANTISKGEMQVNVYSIDSYLVLSDKAKEVLQGAKDFVNRYHWDESDAMQDYFNTNFYFYLYVGKWNKKFVQTA